MGTRARAGFESGAAAAAGLGRAISIAMGGAACPLRAVILRGLGG